MLMLIKISKISINDISKISINDYSHHFTLLAFNICSELEITLGRISHPIPIFHALKIMSLSVIFMKKYIF